MLRNRCRVIAAIISLSVIVGVSQIDSEPEPVLAQNAVAYRYGLSPNVVKRVQYTLRSYGYAVEVDGIYGPQTTKAVKKWQAANGLYADGIAGTQTLSSLGVSLVDPPPAVTTTVASMSPVPAPPPSAPVSGCNAYKYLLERYGLPTGYFLKVMWRESRCDPNQYNGRGRDRSYGLLQINTKSTPRMDLWAELQRRCGLTYREQLFDPETNIACAAQLFSVYGYRPWRTG